MPILPIINVDGTTATLPAYEVTVDGTTGKRHVVQLYAADAATATHDATAYLRAQHIPVREVVSAEQLAL